MAHRYNAHPAAEQAHSAFTFITGLVLFFMFMLAMICGNNKADAREHPCLHQNYKADAILCAFSEDLR